MLNNSDEFIDFVQENKQRFDYSQHTYITKAENIFCHSCSDKRRFDVLKIYSPYDFKDNSFIGSPPSKMSRGQHKRTQPINFVTLNPSLFKFTCTQCDSIIHVLLCTVCDTPTLLALPVKRGQVGTPYTSIEVSYYLDQAYKCEMMGAYSAAITMYRASLEMLLFLEGYTMKMLGPKIGRLEQDVSNGKAPIWARDLDQEFLFLIKGLGDFSIHPNDGDIEKQRTFDADLISGVKTIFNRLWSC